MEPGQKCIWCILRLKYTRAVQPVATCRQSPHLHKPAIVIVTSFLLWCLTPTALPAPILIMTSFSLRHHSLLSWPRPPLQTYVTDSLPRLIYKDPATTILSESNFHNHCCKKFLYFVSIHVSIMLTAGGVIIIFGHFCGPFAPLSLPTPPHNSWVMWMYQIQNDDAENDDAEKRK